MPGFNGTGPIGTGTMGRGLGPCGRGYSRYPRPWSGVRFGYGRGMFRGLRWRYADQFVPPANEEEFLVEEINRLKNALETATNRLNDLQAKK